MISSSAAGEGASRSLSSHGPSRPEVGLPGAAGERLLDQILIRRHALVLLALHVQHFIVLQSEDQPSKQYVHSHGIGQDDWPGMSSWRRHS